jgi:hypothetical protein
MSSRLGRTFVSLILAPYIAISGALPQEHVHEADADHPQSATHRHVQVHDEALRDHRHAQLTEDDGHVVWLGTAVLAQGAYRLLAPVLAVSVVAPASILARTWAAGFDYSSAPPHGPPRPPASLRAPPTSLPALI